MRPETMGKTAEQNKPAPEQKQGNPLAADSIGSLLWKFSVPSIIAMLVSSLYNIVDQFLSGAAWESWAMRPQIFLSRCPFPVSPSR